MVFSTNVLSIPYLVLSFTCLAFAFPSFLEHQWILPDYDWETPEQEMEYKASGAFIPENNAITGVKVYNDEIYVTVPRWLPGVPSTLNKVVSKNGKSVLQPYPSWGMQKIGDPSAFQYIQSMEIDSRGWMWVLDVGELNINDPLTKVPGPAKLVIWDINQNCTIRTFVFPNDVLAWQDSFANDIVVDQHNGYAYISNTVAQGGIVIYDFVLNLARLWTDPVSMAGDPNGNVTINGVPLPLNLGTDGIALSPDAETLYYCTISTRRLWSIKTTYLTSVPPLTNSELASKVVLVMDKPLSDGMTTDNKGYLYYGDLATSSVYTWDPLSNDEPEVLVSNATTMDWPDTFAWDSTTQSLYFTSNRLQLFFLKKLPLDVPNFRIWRVPVGRDSYLSASSPIPSSLPCSIENGGN